jgi:dihydroxyacetone kinase-like protein
VKNEEAGFVVLNLIKAIQDNKDYLSEIDGKIGDGDHGVNMNKGFAMCRDKLGDGKFSLSHGLSVLSRTLQEDIGGSMGPLYGVFFEEMASASEKADVVDGKIFGAMLKNGVDAVLDIGGAHPGDKTLVDVLVPAEKAFNEAAADGKGFAGALADMKEAAEKGWKATEGMVAKVGRASRLGERSRGVPDAGATSCKIILSTIADSFLASEKSL